MPLDPSISLQTKGIEPQNFISGFLDLGLKKNALARGTATLDADIARAQAESARTQTEAGVAAQTAGPRVSQAQSGAGSAAATMSADQLAAMRSHVANAAQQMQTLLADPGLDRKKVATSIAESLANSDAPTSAYGQAFQGMPDAGAPPEAFKQFIVQSLAKNQALSAHLASIVPAPAFVNTGQQAVPVAAGNPALTGVAPGTPQGVPVQMQVPPTATTVGPGNQPAYVGPTGPQGAQSAPIPSGLAPGVAEGVTGPVQVATRHYEGVQQAASAAPTRIAALQTIMQEAPAALTSGGDWRRRLLQQFSGVYELDTQTANDVMAKNLALLAGNAGNTDAARALAEMANPNSHMTKEAIAQTGAQLLGIERKNQAAAQFFTGTPTNDSSYAQKMVQWNRLADPRLFEYANLPADQKAAWMKKLPPGVRADLGMKAQALEQAGVQF